MIYLDKHVALCIIYRLCKVTSCDSLLKLLDHFLALSEGLNDHTRN